jgi:RNA polymerase sigma-70 factor (ECF subfamily)
MDDSGFELAYRTYAAHVYARCMRLLRQREAARDLTQEVFLRCYRDRQGLRSGRELLGWLYRVATNLCLNWHRAQKVRGETRDLAARAEIASSVAAALDGSATSESASMSVADMQVVRAVLDGLDERTQEIAVYIYVDGMTQKEAAAVAGVTDRTIRNCLARFQKHAQQALGLTDARRRVA